MVIGNRKLETVYERSVLENKGSYTEESKIIFIDGDVIDPSLDEDLIWEGNVIGYRCISGEVTHVAVDGFEFPTCSYRVVCVAVRNIVTLRESDIHDRESYLGMAVRIPD